MTDPSFKLWTRQFTREPGDDVDVQMGPAPPEVAGDLFLKYLQEGDHSSWLTFDQVATHYLEKKDPATGGYDVKIYMIADAAHIVRKKLPEGAREWLNARARVICIASTLETPQRHIIIAGSDDVKNPDRFLQVMSWDGKMFYYYAVEDISAAGASGASPQRGWTYQGCSADAFSDGTNRRSEYLGPFGGHVNGACIMKELRRPWTHWVTDGRSVDQCLSERDLERHKAISYLHSGVESAETLEVNIISMAGDWTRKRCAVDFYDEPDLMRIPKTNPSNVARWMAHLFLTTNVNYASAMGVSDDENDPQAPSDHFYNNELLHALLLAPKHAVQLFYKRDAYRKVVQDLDICLLQEVSEDAAPVEGVRFVTLNPGTLGGGKHTDSFDQTKFWVVCSENDTKDLQFVALQGSFEDAYGVQCIAGAAPPRDDEAHITNLAGTPSLEAEPAVGWPFSLSSVRGGEYAALMGEGLLMSKTGPTFLSRRAIIAVVAVDLYNPVYSWRRGVLWEYVPSDTTVDDDGKAYDIEAKFVAAVRASAMAAQEGSPERDFLDAYDSAGEDAYTLQTAETALMERLDQYLKKVKSGLKKGKLEDYIRLAESRRRLYRPLPLNEFGVQLPYALNIPQDTAPLEMLADATVKEIPERGVAFLKGWLGSLHGYDPYLMPAKAGGGCPMGGGGGRGRCPMT